MSATYTDSAGDEIACPNMETSGGVCQGDYLDPSETNPSTCSSFLTEDICPSANGCVWSSTQGLNKTWEKWTETPEDLRNNLSYNQSCFDICGPRNYIQQIGVLVVYPQKDFSKRKTYHLRKLILTHKVSVEIG